MSGEVWTTRALPILEAIGTHEGDDLLDLATLVDETGLPLSVIDVELRRLIHSNFVSGKYEPVMGSSASFLLDPYLTERGARCVGLWPSDDPYELLLELLDKRIAEESDDDARTRWQRIRGTVAEVGKGAVSGLLVELVKVGAGVRF
jgi:hypothetical protein